MSEPLSLAELRELEAFTKSILEIAPRRGLSSALHDKPLVEATMLEEEWERFPIFLRAVRELIAVRERIGTESGTARAIALEYELTAIQAAHDRLRKAAEALLNAQWGPADIVGPIRDALRAALEGK